MTKEREKIKHTIKKLLAKELRDQLRKYDNQTVVSVA